MVSLGITADFTDIVVGNVVTNLAPFDFRSHLQNCLAKSFHTDCILPDQVQSQTKRRFPSYPWKPRQLIHGILQ
jgi:hypothetical protein